MKNSRIRLSALGLATRIRSAWIWQTACMVQRSTDFSHIEVSVMKLGLSLPAVLEMACMVYCDATL